MNDKPIQHRPVALGRRFNIQNEKDDGEQADADWLILDHSLQWEELLKQRRVAVLAEPGAGVRVQAEIGMAQAVL